MEREVHFHLRRHPIAASTLHGKSSSPRPRHTSADASTQNFDKPFWAKGDFPPSTPNGTSLVDPWSQTGRDSTPFDQDFYLILNVAVGG